MADEGIRKELEDQAGKGILVAAFAGYKLVLVAGHMADHGRNIHRRRQVIDNCVKQGLDAHIAESRAAKHGHDIAGYCGLADAGDYFVFREFFTRKILVQQGFVLFGHGFQHFVVLFLEKLLHVLRDFGFREFGALGGLVEIDGPAANQVHHAFILVFRADWQLQRQGLGA